MPPLNRMRKPGGSLKKVVEVGKVKGNFWIDRSAIRKMLVRRSNNSTNGNSLKSLLHKADTSNETLGVVENEPIFSMTNVGGLTNTSASGQAMACRGSGATGAGLTHVLSSLNPMYVPRDEDIERELTQVKGALQPMADAIHAYLTTVDRLTGGAAAGAGTVKWENACGYARRFILHLFYGVAPQGWASDDFNYNDLDSKQEQFAGNSGGLMTVMADAKALPGQQMVLDFPMGDLMECMTESDAAKKFSSFLTNKEDYPCTNCDAVRSSTRTNGNQFVSAAKKTLVLRPESDALRDVAQDLKHMAAVLQHDYVTNGGPATLGAKKQTVDDRAAEFNGKETDLDTYLRTTHLPIVNAARTAAGMGPLAFPKDKDAILADLEKLVATGTAAPAELTDYNTAVQNLSNAIQDLENEKEKTRIFENVNADFACMRALTAVAPWNVGMCRSGCEKAGELLDLRIAQQAVVHMMQPATAKTTLF